MLTAEEARVRLRAVRDLDWRATARARIAALPREHRQPAAVFVDAPPRSSDREALARHRRVVEVAAVHLDGLAADDLRAVTTALHPGLGPVLARWWVDARSAPYQRLWARRAFRAPHDPEVTRRARAAGLRALLERVGPYDGDAGWLAVWAPHLGQEDGRGPGPTATVELAGPVLASAIDAGGADGDRVLATLIRIVHGDDPLATFDRHVVIGLLGAARPEGWTVVEKLLLAAQGQEGLRQAVLGVADEAHPAAFDRLLALVIDHDLARFASTVQSVGVWLGLAADVEQIPELVARLTELRRLRSDPAARDAALASGEPWPTFLALGVVATGDVMAALAAADPVLERPEPGARAAAARFLALTQLQGGDERLTRLLDDPSLPVAALAHRLLTRNLGPFAAADLRDAYEPLERLARRLPERRADADPVGVETEPVVLHRPLVVASLVAARGERPLADLVAWLPAMDPGTRAALARLLGREPALTPELRDALVALVGDRAAVVRRAAVEAMDALGVDPAGAPALEALLTRKTGDLRRGVIGLLVRQPEPADAARSAERLWAAGGAARRDAACEVLAAVAADGDDERAPVVAAARAFVADGVTDRQAELLGDLVSAGEPGGPGGPDDADPGLGLYDPARRSPVPTPRAHAGRRFGSDEALRLAGALDDLAEAHRDTPVLLASWQGQQERLLADVGHQLPSPFQPPGDEADDWRMILPGVFRPWWDTTGADGLDALGALAAVAARFAGERRGDPWWGRVLTGLVGGEVGEIRHPGVVRHVLSWLVAEGATPAMVDECLDAVEASWAAVPYAVLQSTPEPPPPGLHPHTPDWRDDAVRAHPWLHVLHGLLAVAPDLITADRLARFHALLRWCDEPVPGAHRRPVDRALLLAAHRAGAATDADVLEQLLVPSSGLLRDLTGRRPGPLAARYPQVAALAHRLRDRIVEVERRRGELPTPASRPAHEVASVAGVEPAVDLLARLGTAALVRSASSQARDDGREAVFSRLLLVSHPADGDDATALRDAARAAGVADDRLVELAAYAPRWAALVEAALGWPGLEDAVWWLHSHSRDERAQYEDGPDADLRDGWAALAGERTPLSTRDLADGAVDVAWFARSHRALGDERWAVVRSAARLVAGGGGHRRAQSYADALLGRVDEATLVARIAGGRRHQDAVRMLGVLALPPPTDPAGRRAATLRRYGLLREFERGSARFPSGKQAAERAAVRIGIENLARTAGYPDPQRLVWAMEAAEAGDLARGPLTATAPGDVVVTLAVDPEGTPGLTVTRGDKVLKSVPAALKRDPAIVALRDRKTALTRQASRVRAVLEASMVREDPFSPDDLAALDRHPLVAPMLGLLVLVDEAGRTLRRRGDGTGRDGGDLVDVAGRPTAAEGTLRVAHPIDLLDDDWVAWQEQLFVEERRQPFKQAFRELYAITDTERAAGPASFRYEGHQVQPRQALALLRHRGWAADRDDGAVSRAFHRHDLVARLDFLGTLLTPASVELPALRSVWFTRPGTFRAEPLDAVPPVVFSEAMRDLDLVVSVAHAGGVDPEASASTVEMRSALVRETVRLLRLDNVRTTEPHVVIEGSLGEYSVHLGSGVVHRRPGGSVCIIPVDSQRRGRIFLPFADDDPKTAEVVAKILLLAADHRIKDPTILTQLTS